jgi:hypothetical protein
MPLATIWLKIGDIDVRCYKQKVGNDLLIKDPEIVEFVNDEPVRDVRGIAKCHWEQVGTGKQLIAQTTLMDEQGKEVPQSEAICILDHTNNPVLNKKAEKVDKKLITYHLLNQDGSIGDQVMPFPPTDKLEILPENLVPSTVMEPFLISEEYELPAADPRNDPKVYAEAEKALKEDLVGLTVYSNGGFSQYYAFVVPVLREGQFVWTLRISTKKVKYNCLHDVPATTKIPFKEVKTLETLPPIASLLTLPTAKKKK